MIVLHNKLVSINIHKDMSHNNNTYKNNRRDDGKFFTFNSRVKDQPWFDDECREKRQLFYIVLNYFRMLAIKESYLKRKEIFKMNYAERDMHLINRKPKNYF